MRLLLLLAVALGTTACTVQCGEGTHEVDGMCVLDLTDADAIREMCKDGSYDVATFDVTFPKLDPGCPWNEGDNMGAVQTTVTARVEQYVTLEMPEGAVACDLNFDFTGGEGVYQNMEYDDFIYLVFDGVILTSTHRDLVDPMPLDEAGMPVYDWASIVGSGWPYGDNDVYCLGEDEGSWCEIPPTESAGRISLQYNRDTVADLAWRIAGRTDLEMLFVTTGDNDPDTDCRHEDFSFSVDVPWIPVE